MRAFGRKTEDSLVAAVSSVLNEKKIEVEITVDDSDNPKIKAAAKQFSIKMKKLGETELQISGEQKNVIKFMKSSGWSEKEIKKWYPNVFEATLLDEGKKLKPFAKVKKGDRIQDYGDEWGTVIKTGKLKDLVRDDRSGGIQDMIDSGDLDPNDPGVVVRLDSYREVVVYVYGYDGAYVEESTEAEDIDQLDEAMQTKWDRDFQAQIKVFSAFPWDEKPRKVVQSALHMIEATARGYVFVLSWHQPHSKWGPDWTFLGLDVSRSGLYAKHKEMFNKTREQIWALPNIGTHTRLPEAMVKANLDEFRNANEFLKNAFRSSNFEKLMEELEFTSPTFMEQLELVTEEEWFRVVGIDKKGKVTKSDLLMWPEKKNAQKVCDQLNAQVKSGELDDKWVKFKLEKENVKEDIDEMTINEMGSVVVAVTRDGDIMKSKPMSPREADQLKIAMEKSKIFKVVQIKKAESTED